MNNIKLPCFYYPTTVTVLDDDQIFLENLTSNLSDQIQYQRFDNPTLALTFLQQQQNTAPSSQEFLQADSSDDFAQHGKSVVNVNLANIHNKLYNKQRFDITSVVVVDHDMPGMNGIEFCKKLDNNSIKKIMLTGVADHKIAINAFNDGVIHKFIMKDDPNVFEAIDKAIFEIQQDYFFDLSELIIKNITASTFSYLSNKKFISFFMELIKKNSIAEFYLIDAIGSFLLVKNNGDIMWLIVKSDQEIANDLQIAIDQDAPKEIINILKEKKELLFLFTEEDYKQPVEKWPAHLYQAKIMENVDGCYYALIQGEMVSRITGIHKDKIYSYVNYLQK